MPRPVHLSSALPVCFVVILLAAGRVIASSDFLLITSDLETVPVRLIAVDEQRLSYAARGGEHEVPRSRALHDSIALLRDPPPERAPADQGMVRLADGRQFPGEPATPRTRTQGETGEVFAWHSNWLGRMDVRLEDVDWIIIEPGVSPPPSGRADVVLLANGDVLEGFILSIRRVVELEVDGDGGVSTLELPLDRVAAINLIAPARPQGKASTARRAWLADGTILDVTALEIDEAGAAHLARPGGASTARLDARHLAAVLLSPGRLLPLAQLQPAQVSGPETRYAIPEPRAMEQDAMLGLSPIELRGPLTVEYNLPPGAKRFAAEVELPRQAREWGDYELIVRVDGRELFRERLSASQPHAKVNIEAAGESLSIEIEPGLHGPIQNHAVLNRAMLLVQ